ncbi:hypothetical protein H0H87_009233 [Tephrocybe sp. NHM501043]|nr:hypothetical protein H0H87_009233 [Tephrocybe sp. NHM501043]
MNYTNPATFSTAQLKRNRPPIELSGREPPLPKISSDLILQVFTHISLRRATGDPEDYGDNERFIHLGELVLDATVTHVLFNKRPLLTTQEIISEREAALSDANLNKWVTMYKLRQKIRCLPDVFPFLDSSKETRSLFCAYVGGVYAESGIETVQEWMSHLLISEDTRFRPSEHYPQAAEPPSKKVKSEEPSPYHSAPTPYQPSSIFFASQPPPSPPTGRQRQPPPHMHLSLNAASSHMPPLVSLPNPLAPAQPSLPFLPLFNQTAAQRRVAVDYPAEFSGPPHAGQWNVRCIVNGIEKGIGTGPSKQIAKEEAARQAYYAMGWT